MSWLYLKEYEWCESNVSLFQIFRRLFFKFLCTLLVVVNWYYVYRADDAISITWFWGVMWICQMVVWWFRRHFAQKNIFFANSFFDKNLNANILFYQKSSQVSERSAESIEIERNKWPSKNAWKMFRRNKSVHIHLSLVTLY